MKCQEFESNITDLLHGELEESRRREALAHALACKRCGVALDAERRLTAELHALAAGQRTEEAPARVEQQLAAAFRAHSARPTRLPPRLRDSLLANRRWWLWGTAAVGMALGAVIIAGLLRRPAVNPVAEAPRPQSTAPGTATHEARASDAPAFFASQVSGAVQARAPEVKRTPQASPPRRVSDRAEPVEVEVVTGFYTIPYVEPVGPEESVRVVRTSVPRYWLTALGLPSGDDRAFDPVPADVLVGEDNVARAVRFVQQWQLPRPASQGARPTPVNARYVP